MSRPLGLLLGYAADRALGDPRRFHPVAGFGRTAAALERRTYDDTRRAGALHVGILVGGTALLGSRVGGPLSRPLSSPVGGTLATAVATWVVLGGTSLDREAAAVQALLSADRLADAQQRLTHLVGRDTSGLAAPGVARAVVESVAENTSDAVIAPLVWGAIAGVPGLLAYRAANTLDAMVGHHSERYERFGWAAARLDDVLNVPGARLTAALAVLLGDDRPGAVRAWRRDAAGHPSPNAGPVEAAFAGALGLRLGGETTYPGPPARVEHRPRLGDGSAPGIHDVTRARSLARRIGLAAALVCAGLSAIRAPTRRR